MLLNPLKRDINIPGKLGYVKLLLFPGFNKSGGILLTCAKKWVVVALLDFFLHPQSLPAQKNSKEKATARLAALQIWTLSRSVAVRSVSHGTQLQLLFRNCLSSTVWVSGSWQFLEIHSCWVLILVIVA